MSFVRPTLAEHVAAIEADIIARLELDAILRRSNLAALARVAAGSAHLLHAHLDSLSTELIPDTATGENLERWASLFIPGRKAASFASGVVRFTGSSGTIPAGTKLRRSDGFEYSVTVGGTISFPAQVDLIVAGVVAGVDGNADEGTELVLVSPIAGVDNTATVLVGGGGLIDGTDVETDDALRLRLLQRIQEPPQGGAIADYEGWALAVPAVTRAFVKPANRGIGTVDVTFLVDDTTGGPIPGAGKVAEVDAYLNDPVRKVVTADVQAVAPTTLDLDPDITVTPDTAAVRAAIEANLADLLMTEAEPGKTLPLSRIAEAISTAPGEESHTLNSPVADVVPTALQVIVLGTVTFTP